MQGNIISLLNAALTPFLDNFTFKYDDKIVESIIPAPQNIPCVMKNEPFNIFVFFKDGCSIENIDT
jgi:hypothetical protein